RAISQKEPVAAGREEVGVLAREAAQLAGDAQRVPRAAPRAAGNRRARRQRSVDLRVRERLRAPVVPSQPREGPHRAQLLLDLQARAALRPAVAGGGEIRRAPATEGCPVADDSGPVALLSQRGGP